MNRERSDNRFHLCFVSYIVEKEGIERTESKEGGKVWKESN